VWGCTGQRKGCLVDGRSMHEGRRLPSRWASLLFGLMLSPTLKGGPSGWSIDGESCLFSCWSSLGCLGTVSRGGCEKAGSMSFSGGRVGATGCGSRSTTFRGHGFLGCRCWGC
jgi:hypothetical protein